MHLFKNHDFQHLCLLKYQRSIFLLFKFQLQYTFKKLILTEKNPIIL